MKTVPYVVCAPTIIAGGYMYVQTGDFTTAMISAGIAGLATFVGFITLLMLIGDWITK